MKKSLLSFAVLMMGAALFTACNNDDDAPEVKKVDVSNGVFVLGSGNQRSNIDGNLSYIDYTSGTVTANAFQKANGKSLGKTANYIADYGSKLYIVVDAEATIWVCDKATLRVIQQIKTTDLLGEKDGASPRAAVGMDGKLYFTCYGDSYNGGNGVLAAVDTLTFQAWNTYEVGSYPDGLTVANGCIYVANSDYGMGVKPSISKVNPQTLKVEEIKDDLITNPMQMVTIGSDVYSLDYGTYDEMWNQVGAGVRKITASGNVTKVVDGTAMGTDGKKIYTAYAPWGAAEITYLIYDPATGATTSWSPEGIFSPGVIAVDPVSGNIFIVSYQQNPDTGYADYALPSYTNQYDAQGKFVKKFENTATGPISVVFNTGVKYVQE
ncbi:MAG: hypothetical protein IJR02_08130 [Bacteroidaceae bacterium]|nr:hypothetical protein [Bacteroidaceae bacterium]MBQ6750718.1 hypothetical protein [Bacteroidaceae bacterium]